MLLGKFVFVAEESRWSHYLFQVNYAMNLFFYDYFISDWDLSSFDYFCRRQIFSSESFFSTTALPTPSSSAVKQISWHIVLSYLLLLNNFKKFISSKESCSEIPGNTFALQTNYLLGRVSCLVVA